MDWILTYGLGIFLAADTLFLSISGGVTLRPFKGISALKIAITFTIVLSFAAVTAFYLAQLISGLLQNLSNILGHILIAFVGVRYMIDAKKLKNEDRTYLLEDTKILLSSSLAASFVIFIAFFGLGFLTKNLSIAIIVLSISVFVLAFTGVFIGSHYQPLRLGRSSKFASGILIVIFLVIHFIKQF